MCYLWATNLYTKGMIMLKASITFFLLGIFSMVLGAYGIAGLSIDIGKIFLAIFMLFATISFIINFISGRRIKQQN
jgi:hypothetical protein